MCRLSLQYHVSTVSHRLVEVKRNHFWEDLINLSDRRSHYTGVLTLTQLPETDIPKNEKEYWLVNAYSHKVYHVVDGQQRLTTFVIFLQALVDLVKRCQKTRGFPPKPFTSPRI